MKKIRTDVVALVQMGMLAAIAVVLVMLIHFPIIPAVSFIEYDMADVPVLIGTLLYGPIPGLLILLVASLVQAFILGINGWVGFVMHFVASGAMVLLVGILYDRKPSLTGMDRGHGVGLPGQDPGDDSAQPHFDRPRLRRSPRCGDVPDAAGHHPHEPHIAVTNCILAGLLFMPSPPSCRKIATLHRESNAAPLRFGHLREKFRPVLSFSARRAKIRP